MKKVKKTKKPAPVKLTPKERSVRLREQHIVRLHHKKKKLYDWYLQDCAAIDGKIAQARVLLEAVKAGRLQV